MFKYLLVALLWTCGTFSVQSQEFSEKWTMVDSMELKGKIESADKLVQEIKISAKKNKDYSNYLKAQIFHFKFYQINHEASNSYILQELKTDLKFLPFPYRNILYSYKAQILKDYLDLNRYNMYNRKKIDNPEDFAIDTWSRETLLDSIQNNYQKSLQQAKELVDFPVEKTNILVQKNNLNRQLRPGLYDLLAYRAIDFYKNTSNYSKKFYKYKIDVTSPLFFDVSGRFQQYQFTPDFREDPVAVALKIFQSLEKLNAENELPYTQAVLARLNFLNEQPENSEGNENYLNGLAALQKNTNSKEALGYIQLELAEMYYAQGDKTDESDDILHPEYILKSEETAKKIIADFPGTNLAQFATRLLVAINEKVFYGEIREKVLPETPTRMLVNYRNVDSIKIKIFRVSYSESFNYNVSKRDSVLGEKFSRKARFDSVYPLKHSKDHNLHSTEVLLPQLPIGSYLIISQITQENGDKNYDNNYFKVSNLAYTKLDLRKTTKITVLNATTGEALENVGYADDKLLGILKSSKSGNIELNNIESSREKGYIFYKGDTLSGYFRNYLNYSNNNLNQFQVNIPIYLDRAIYRPGQTVYFKGILLQEDHKKSSVVANEYVDVIVEDANGNEIENFTFKTNDYGSFNDKFTLPSSGITGNFRIYAEDSGKKSPFWDRINRNNQSFSNGVSFKVEEYKRPTFEVSFIDSESSYTLNDSVQITGNAKSYLGSTVNNARVTYSITRKKEIRTYWYSYFSDEVTLVQDSVQTDAQGKFIINFKATPNSSEESNSKLNYLYTIKAAVTDISGETRTADYSLKVGKVKRVLEIDSDGKVQSGEDLKVVLKSTNLNDNPVKTSGNLKIYKILTPLTFQTERIWPSPEFPGFTEEEFHRLFPHEPYISQPKDADPELGEMVYEKFVQIDGSRELTINFDKKWQAGKYLLQLTSADQDSVRAVKEVNLINPKDKYLADNQALEANITPIENNPEAVQLEIKTAYKELYVQVLVFDGYREILRDFAKVNGNKSYQISTKNVESDKLQVIVSGVKENIPVTSTFNYVIQVVEKNLSISTSTFRNKLEPGTNETWSFNIKNEKDEGIESEVLASMYDASLDQFTSSNWDSNNLFSEGYFRGPRFEPASLNSTQNLGYSDYSNGYRSYEPDFDELNFFGFQYSQPNSWFYRKYLERQKYLQKNKDNLVSGNSNGVVTDEAGNPLAGVNVIIQGKTLGTQTDFDGQFSLDYSKDDVLVFAYVGYTTTEVVINDDNPLYIIMKEDSAQMNEVVVLGYGDQMQKSLTGSASGLAIQEDSVPLQIRGLSSLENNQNALFVVDGVLVGNMPDMNTEDVLSVTVLKGSEATALYGSKGANGVVLITTKKAAEALSKVAVRKNLDETAFFFPELHTNEQGDLSFSFTSPEALTRWKLRLLAHTKNWMTGNLTETVVTQKELSLTPNAPRFLREKDSILIKIKIANLTEENMNGMAKLQLFNALTMQAVDSLVLDSSQIQNFSVDAAKNTTVNWKLIIPQGIPAITYRVTASSGKFSDGEENTLPVLTNRMLVTESIPLFVRAGQEKKFQIENLLEESETRENYLLSLEYSSNPAWYAVQSLPYLMNYDRESSDQIFNMVFANSVSRHILESQPQIKEVFAQWEKDSSLVSSLEKNSELKSLDLSETPWVRDAASETSKKQELAKLFDENRLIREETDNLNRLEWMQFPNGAFPWFKGGAENTYITRYIVAGLGHLQKLNVTIPENNVAEKAIRFLDEDFMEQWKKREEKKISYSYSSDLHYLYARSFYLKKFPLPAANKEAALKIINNLKSDFSLDLYSEALRVLVFNRMNEQAAAKELLVALQEKAVKSETYGMYWKENKSGWRWYQNPVETQSLLIQAFEEVGNSNVTDELKIWLLQNKRTNNWASTKATAEACYALLLQGDNWLSVSDNTKITMGGEAISKSKWKSVAPEAGTGYIKLNWQPDEFTSEDANITITNSGDHPGFGGAYWQYFEDLDKIKVQDSMPLQVQKELYLNVPGKNETELRRISTTTPLQIGDLVTVRLVISSESDMDFIHLKDMRASGFEPVNVISEYKYSNGLGYYQSTKDAATHFYFDNLNKGTFVLEYTLRANNAGNFSNGITTIESLYAPEFSSHTKGIRVEISE